MSSNKKWAIVVPYRDRAHHLAVFIPYYNSLFPGVPIYVVEQADTKPFNRAKLANCWAKEELQNFDYFIFHDVDMFLDPSYSSTYTDAPDWPTCLATMCSQFKYKKPYAEYFGGVTAFPASSFIEVNGFSNKYFSYGGEDDSMYRELLEKRIVPMWREARYECFEHPRPLNQELYKVNLELLAKGKSPDDGLTSCEYKLLSKENRSNYTHIKVEL